eukprot:1709654-Amphidinium_carterae.1
MKPQDSPETVILPVISQNSARSQREAVIVEDDEMRSEDGRERSVLIQRESSGQRCKTTCSKGKRYPHCHRAPFQCTIRWLSNTKRDVFLIKVATSHSYLPSHRKLGRCQRMLQDCCNSAVAITPGVWVLRAVVVLMDAVEDWFLTSHFAPFAISCIADTLEMRVRDLVFLSLIHI